MRAVHRLGVALELRGHTVVAAPVVVVAPSRADLRRQDRAVVLPRALAVDLDGVARGQRGGHRVQAQEVAVDAPLRRPVDAHERVVRQRHRPLRRVDRLGGVFELHRLAAVVVAAAVAPVVVALAARADLERQQAAVLAPCTLAVDPDQFAGGERRGDLGDAREITLGIPVGGRVGHHLLAVGERQRGRSGLPHRPPEADAIAPVARLEPNRALAELVHEHAARGVEQLGSRAVDAYLALAPRLDRRRTRQTDLDDVAGHQVPAPVVGTEVHQQHSRLAAVHVELPVPVLGVERHGRRTDEHVRVVAQRERALRHRDRLGRAHGQQCGLARPDRVAADVELGRLLPPAHAQPARPRPYGHRVAVGNDDRRERAVHADSELLARTNLARQAQVQHRERTVGAVDRTARRVEPKRHELAAALALERRRGLRVVVLREHLVALQRHEGRRRRGGAGGAVPAGRDDARAAAALAYAHGDLPLANGTRRVGPHHDRHQVAGRALGVVHAQRQRLVRLHVARGGHHTQHQRQRQEETAAAGSPPAADGCARSSETARHRSFHHRPPAHYGARPGSRPTPASGSAPAGPRGASAGRCRVGVSRNSASGDAATRRPAASTASTRQR